MTQTKEEKEKIQELKINFNRLHAAGQLLVEIAKECMPKDEDDIKYATEFLEVLHELTTSIPRAYIQLLHDNGEESRDFPVYPFLLTGFPSSMVYAWIYIKKYSKVFKGGKKKLADQLDAVETHLYACSAIITDIYKYYRAVAVVHKKTGVVTALLPEDLTGDNKDEYIEICPDLLCMDRKYMDAVYECCTCEKAKRRKDTLVYTVPASAWPKKGKGRMYNSDAFAAWLKKVRIAICTKYDLSYNENL